MNVKKNNYLKGLGVIFVLCVLSSILLFKVNSIISERKSYRNLVQNEIQNKWGSPLKTGNYYVSIPKKTIKYRLELKDPKLPYGDKIKIPYESIAPTYYMPELLNIDIDTKVKNRYLGIYKVPVYDASFKGDMVFDLTKSKKYFKSLDMDQIKLVFDIKAGKEISKLSIEVDGKQVEPIVGHNNILIILNKSHLKKQLSVKLKMLYKGSQNLLLNPSGKRSNISLKSNWKDPSFIGYRLPDVRVINKEGFQAKWHTLNFANDIEKMPIIQGSGVKLFNSFDIYHMTERSLKYGMLFILLTFLGFYLVSILNDVEIHGIQYGFIMASLVEFYFLLLSLTEHIKFEYAFILASIGTILTISIYALTIIKDKKVSLFIGSELTLLYTFLFITIKSKDYALLSGSLGLFVIIGLAMFLTRNIDWSAQVKKIDDLEEIEI